MTKCQSVQIILLEGGHLSELCWCLVIKCKKKEEQTIGLTVNIEKVKIPP